MCVLLLYMCSRTAIYSSTRPVLCTNIYVSSYMYVLLVLYMSPIIFQWTYTNICVSQYYICVLLLLYMCSYTTIYVSSYCMCPIMYASSYVYVLLLYVCSYHLFAPYIISDCLLYICPPMCLLLLYMCALVLLQASLLPLNLCSNELNLLQH